MVRFFGGCFLARSLRLRQLFKILIVSQTGGLISEAYLEDYWCLLRLSRLPRTKYRTSRQALSVPLLFIIPDTPIYIDALTPGGAMGRSPFHTRTMPTISATGFQSRGKQ